MKIERVECLLEDIKAMGYKVIEKRQSDICKKKIHTPENSVMISRYEYRNKPRIQIHIGKEIYDEIPKEYRKRCIVAVKADEKQKRRANIIIVFVNDHELVDKKVKSYKIGANRQISCTKVLKSIFKYKGNYIAKKIKWLDARSIDVFFEICEEPIVKS